jgi:acyl carrier protein
VTLEEIVRMLIARYGRADPQGVSMTLPLEVAGVDSIGAAEMAIYLGARFGIDIGAHEASEWTTGNEIMVALRSRLGDGVLANSLPSSLSLDRNASPSDANAAAVDAK